jgi:hypothetical protein
MAPHIEDMMFISLTYDDDDSQKSSIRGSAMPSNHPSYQPTSQPLELPISVHTKPFIAPRSCIQKYSKALSSTPSQQYNRLQVRFIIDEVAVVPNANVPRKHISPVTHTAASRLLSHTPQEDRQAAFLARLEKLNVEAQRRIALRRQKEEEESKSTSRINDRSIIQDDIIGGFVNPIISSCGGETIQQNDIGSMISSTYAGDDTPQEHTYFALEEYHHSQLKTICKHNHENTSKCTEKEEEVKIFGWEDWLHYGHDNEIRIQREEDVYNHVSSEEEVKIFGWEDWLV